MKMPRKGTYPYQQLAALWADFNASGLRIDSTEWDSLCEYARTRGWEGDDPKDLIATLDAAKLPAPSNTLGEWADIIMKSKAPLGSMLQISSAMRHVRGAGDAYEEMVTFYWRGTEDPPNLVDTAACGAYLRDLRERISANVPAKMSEQRRLQESALLGSTALLSREELIDELARRRCKAKLNTAVPEPTPSTRHAKVARVLLNLVSSGVLKADMTVTDAINTLTDVGGNHGY